MTPGEERWLTRCPGCDAKLPDQDRYREALEAIAADGRKHMFDSQMTRQHMIRIAQKALEAK